MSETWKPVPGREEQYAVSNHGRVLSFRRRTPQLLTPQRFSNGYVGVYLGRGKCHLVHRLVMEAFVGPSKLQVNHKNRDRSDNALSNLEYVTTSENHRHSHASGTRKRHAWTREVVVTGTGNTGVKYPSVNALARELHVDPGSVSSAIRRCHKVRGLEVRFA